MTRYFRILSLNFAVVAISLTACKKQQPETVIGIKPVPKPVVLLNRANFPCTDSLKGVWRLYKYEVGGRTTVYDKVSYTVRWGVGADSIHFFQNDTLIYRFHYQFLPLTTKSRRPPTSDLLFTHQLTSGNQVRIESNLQGSYALFKGDTLFLYSNYDDGANQWFVRDCK